MRSGAVVLSIICVQCSLPQAVRVKEKLVKGMDIIGDSTPGPIDTERFPALAAFAYGNKKRHGWSRYINNISELFGQMSGDQEPRTLDEGEDDTRSIVLASVSRCWRPSPKNTNVYTQPERLEEMLQALKKEVAQLHSDALVSKDDFRPVHMASPILDYPLVGGKLPHHHLISFTHEGEESRCLHNFDYSVDHGPDPAGCRFFRASFEPIQKLSRCVMQKVAADPYRKMWKVFYAGKSKDDAAKLLPEMLKVFAEADAKPNVTVEVVAKELENWAECQKPHFRKKCDQMNTFYRSMELLKRVEFKDWSTLTYSELHDVLKRSIVGTASTPPQSAIPSLSDSTVNSIIESCFEFPAPELELYPEHGGQVTLTDITTQDEKAWWTDTPGYAYKEILKCLPLIWDSVEVPRAPFQMLWFNTGKRPVEHDFKGAHPLCGRLAMAPLAIEWRERRTKYADGLEQVGDSAQKNFEGSTCFKRKHATCKTLAECWVFLMQKHMPDLNQHCSIEQPGPFDITTELPSVKRAGLSCCCDKETSWLASGDAPYHPCKIMPMDKCEDGKLDYSETNDGKCRVTGSGGELFVTKQSPPDYCRRVLNALHQRKDLRIAHRSANYVPIPPAKLGDVVEAPCLDGTMGKVQCLYSTPKHGRWGTVQCASTKAGWCPAETSEWYAVPDATAAKIGSHRTPECISKYRRSPLHAKTTCGSVNGFLQTSCVYDPEPPFID